MSTVAECAALGRQSPSLEPLKSRRCGSDLLGLGTGEGSQQRKATKARDKVEIVVREPPPLWDFDFRAESQDRRPGGIAHASWCVRPVLPPSEIPVTTTTGAEPGRLPAR